MRNVESDPFRLAILGRFDYAARSMSKKKQNGDIEELSLYRAGSVVSSLTGAFGSQLRETRLTALLGYVMALKPEPFMKLFGFRGTPQSISLETRHGLDRSDILVRTSSGTGVVEAKATAVNPTAQAKKYDAKWRALLTPYLPSTKESKAKNTRYCTWRDVANVLVELRQSTSAPLRFVSRDLLKYMEEYRMIRKKDPVEIYAREINERYTLEMFLECRLYGCAYEQGSRLPEALYFAPHFGQSIAKQYPGVNVGISYIAQIETQEVVETWKDWQAVMAAVRGKAWLKRHTARIAPLHKRWNWTDGKKRTFLFLGEPRLVFNPPVLKENLQKGKGWLSKRFLSFDTLFAAWGC